MADQVFDRYAESNGERFDSSLNLYHLRARYYNMLTGRFETMDPDGGDISDPATLNKYAYAGGDPVDLTDPTGMDIFSYTLQIRNTVYKVAIHSAHHYWTLPILGRLWCVHLALYSIESGVGLNWSQQIPLPWCSGAGPF